LADCVDGRPQQLFTADGSYAGVFRIRSAFDATKCVDVFATGNPRGINAYTCHGAAHDGVANQEWTADGHGRWKMSLPEVEGCLEESTGHSASHGLVLAECRRDEDSTQFFRFDGWSPPPRPPPYPPGLAPSPSPAAPPLPARPPPWPPGGAPSINARFVHGQPSNVLQVAGVLVHQADTMDAWDAPWQTASGRFEDRLAASLVNSRLPYMYSTSATGFVLRPALAQGVIRCSYGRDGNSYNMQPHGCGWNSHPPDAFDDMMRENEQKGYEGSCCYGGVSAEDRGGCRYNEVVLDGWKYSEQLPNIIEAVFFPINGQVDKWEGSEDSARDVHAKMLQQYDLSAAQLPLLSFDVEVARSGGEPFRDARS